MDKLKAVLLTSFMLEKKKWLLITCFLLFLSLSNTFLLCEKPEDRGLELFFSKRYLVFFYLPFLYISFGFLRQSTSELFLARFRTSRFLLMMQIIRAAFLAFFCCFVELCVALPAVLKNDEMTINLLFLVINTFFFTFFLLICFEFLTRLFRHSLISFFFLFGYLFFEDFWVSRFNGTTLFAGKWYFDERPDLMEIYSWPDLGLIWGILALLIICYSESIKFAKLFSRKGEG